MNRTILEVRNLHSGLKDPEKATRSLFAAIDRSGRFPIRPGHLSVAFLDDTRIARVHGDFMDDPTPTDVITFPADTEMASAGEIVVSVDRARDRADEAGLCFSRELSLYLIHGRLHLAGYDDGNDTDRRRMRLAEKTALDMLEPDGLTDRFQLKTEASA